MILKNKYTFFFDYIGKVVAFFFSNISLTTSSLNKKNDILIKKNKIVSIIEAILLPKT